MAKYSVNGTEVIKDDGTIPWARIVNAAAYQGPQSIEVSYTNCSTRGDITVTKSGATGAVTIYIAASGGAGYDCACDCACSTC